MQTREKRGKLSPLKWFFETLPRTFRRHAGAFWLSLKASRWRDARSADLPSRSTRNPKPVLLPFSHLQGRPCSERVHQEESATGDRLQGVKATFSAELMTHNTRVSIATMALGMSWGIGTILMLFYNGIILGAVAVDYIHAGQTKFLLGWLLPHGVVEIPAILIAGQAGLMLAGALIGRGNRDPLWKRLRSVSGDLVTLIFGVGVMLVWAGFIESFLSQYHEARDSLHGQDCVRPGGTHAAVRVPVEVGKEGRKNCTTAGGNELAHFQNSVAADDSRRKLFSNE